MWPVSQNGLAGACGNSKIMTVPWGFWSQLWKGAEQRYSVMEQQLYVVYNAL